MIADIIAGAVMTDWHRYGIANCKWPEYLPLSLIAPATHTWEVLDDAVLSWDWDLGSCAPLIPRGYRFDGASIPGSLASFADPIKALIASLVHDILYESQGGFRMIRVWTTATMFSRWRLLDATTGDPPLIDGNSQPSHERRRARADAIYRAFLLACGNTVHEADRQYAVLRICGRSAWDNEEPASNADPAASAPSIFMGALP